MTDQTSTSPKVERAKTKKVILLHTTGRLAGIPQVLGDSGEIGPGFVPPTCINCTKPEPVVAWLMRQTSRAIYYQEVPAPQPPSDQERI